jgi:hypothetical protein
VSPPTQTRNRWRTSSLIDRLALRIAKLSRTAKPSPVTGPPSPPAGDDGKLSRRKVLNRALGAGGLAMLPLRLAAPDAAQAEGYCAAQCLDDANAVHDARLSKCFASAFGTDIPDAKALAAYAASKIKSGGLGALVLVNEIARADACGVVTEIRYYRDAGKCGEPNCGNPAKYPPHSTGACQNCQAGSHCCVCRDYNDGKPLPNVLVNGGYSCSTYCSTLGFTVISDTPC